MDDDLSFGDFRLLDVDNLLYLPIHTPIRLLITSQDVIHSFFIPSFGIKLDAIPGRINSTSLYILREGLFTGQCAELCGDNHSNMSILIKGTKLKLFNE
jgi:cytochrome c oxidase subunit 2